MKYLYIGSFDPITNGHMDIINQVEEIFACEDDDAVEIIVMSNDEKQHLLTLKERWKLVRAAVPSYINVSSWSEGLSSLIHSTREQASTPVTIIRGLRNITDFEYEQSIREFIELSGAYVVYLTPSSENLRVSSSLVRNLIKYNIPYKQFVPNPEMLNDELVNGK